MSGEPGAWVFQRVGRMLVRIPGSTEHPLEMSPGDPGHILGLASLCTQLTLTCQPSSTPVYVAESLSQAPACPPPSLEHGHCWEPPGHCRGPAASIMVPRGHVSCHQF